MVDICCPDDEEVRLLAKILEPERKDEFYPPEFYTIQPGDRFDGAAFLKDDRENSYKVTIAAAQVLIDHGIATVVITLTGRGTSKAHGGFGGCIIVSSSAEKNVKFDYFAKCGGSVTQPLREGRPIYGQRVLIISMPLPAKRSEKHPLDLAGVQDAFIGSLAYCESTGAIPRCISGPAACLIASYVIRHKGSCQAVKAVYQGSEEMDEDETEEQQAMLDQLITEMLQAVGGKSDTALTSATNEEGEIVGKLRKLKASTDEPQASGEPASSGAFRRKKSMGTALKAD